MNRLCSLLMLLATGLLAQNAPPTVTGSVSGHVWDTDSNMPISGVKVIAAQEDRSGGVEASTDSEGRYVIPNLPVGRRSMEVYDGNLGPSMTAPQVVTVIGGRDTQVDFRTRIFAQVSGRVLDDEGNPLPGMQVTANYKQYDDTGKLWLVSRRATRLTDDQGRYTIITMSAGQKYWIVANSPKLYPNPLSDVPADPQSRRRTFAATYYPNSKSIETASAILLHTQEMRDGVDIVMSKVKSYCLDATLTESGVPRGMRFLLFEKEVTNTPGPSTYFPNFASSSDGKIRLCDLYPGRFQLIAARLSGGQTSNTAVDVTITDNDVRDLVVAAIPPSRVSGDLVWDKQPIDASSSSINVWAYPSLGAASRTPLSIPATFVLEVVAGLSHVVNISGLNSRSYVKEVTYDSSSILQKPFVPAGGDARLRITIGTDAASLTTTVLAANGQPAAGAGVLIVPVSARSESEVAATLRAGYTDEHGSYREIGLPPGKYDVFATNDPGPGAYGSGQILLIYRTPEAIGKIMRARARGKIVDVGPNAAVSVSLAPIRMD
jgi:hypothetical protein